MNTGRIIHILDVPPTQQQWQMTVYVGMPC